MDKEQFIGKPKPELVKDRDTAAVLELLVPATRRGGTAKSIDSSGVRFPDRYLLEGLAQEKAEDITTAKNHTEMLTDIQLAREVLVSSIMSPQDMISNEVTFEIDNNKLPAEIIAAAREVLDTHFTTVYNITDYLPDAIDEALFGSGADARIVIPITALDSVINHGGRVSLEAIGSQIGSDGLPASLGILGPSDFSGLKDGTLERNVTKLSPTGFGVKFALEALGANVELNWNKQSLFDSSCLVNDNYDTLKLPALALKITQESIDRAIASHAVSGRLKQSHEAFEGKELTSVDEAMTLVNNRLHNVSSGAPLGVATTIRAPELYNKRPTARPLVMKVPTESLIPVHVPGNPQEHVGYFLIQDQEGNPLWLSKGSQNYRQLANRLRSNNYDIKNSIGDNSYRQMFGAMRDDRPVTNQSLLDAYGSIMEDDLKSRLRNGAFKSGVELNISNEIKRIMFARKLANCGTVLTFVPKQQVTYFAFYYNDDGFGESLMDRTKIIATIRSVLLFANTMASVRKSVGNTELKIELDPDDDDPAETVEYLFHEFSRTRNRAFPLAANNANDSVTFLQNAGVSVTVSGNTKYPETRSSTEDRSVGNIDVDTELEDRQRDKHWQGFGLSPELIDGLSSPNFAESIVSGNLLMAKRVLGYQKIGIRLGSEHCQRYIKADGLLFEDLVKAVGDELLKLKDEAIRGLYDYYELDYDNQGDSQYKYVTLIRALSDDIIDNYKIVLPSPDVSKFAQQVDAMNKYGEALDMVLKNYITPDMISTLVNTEDGSAVDNFFAMVKGYFMREWLRRNNVMPELECLLDLKGETGANVVESVRTHNEQLQDVLGELFRIFDRKSRQFEHDLEADKNQDEKTLGGDFDKENSGGSDFGGGGDDFGGSTGGSDDFADTTEEPVEGNDADLEGDFMADTETPEEDQDAVKEPEL